MRALFTTTLLLSATLALPAVADTTTTASGAGANVSIVSGSNGGTTIVINTDKPCRTEAKSAGKSLPGSASARVNTNPGGLSGSSSAGPNGVSINVGGGKASGSVGNEDSVAATNQARSGECLVVIHGPSK
ncbi:MAG TPA: hypothetical protein VHU15_10710 [Stellaceae bacterium]|jgi:hypothetical protein|nr:hypothetical protein [Stellaceae bacterium]